MTLTQSDITDGQWNRYDQKEFAVHITGEQLTQNANLRFVVLSRDGGSILLEKTTGDGIVIEQDAADEWRDVIVTIGTNESDYEYLPQGVYYWELYDVDSSLKIGEGSATLGHGLPPSES